MKASDTKTHAPNDIQITTWNFSDSRISECISPIFMRQNCTNIVVLDLTKERQVLLNQIKYWCLNITVLLFINVVDN